MGSAKASVLPEPVGDFASTSTPASASGRTSAWMRKGWVKPRVSSAEATASDTPSSRKDCCDIGSFDSFLDSVETRVTRIQEEREAHLRSRHSADRCPHSSSEAAPRRRAHAGVLYGQHHGENQCF